jgi:two-component system, cell cycle sensor histidine kinase and response regulator CckA
VPHVSQVREISLGMPAMSDGLVRAAAPKPSTILLVEDEGFVREVACKVLESSGYRVLSTRNAAEAKRKFRSCGEGIELLLTDVVLPGRDGLTLANDLRAICPTLKTIFMSGYPENAVTLTGLHKQQGLYLHKPFSTASLIEMIRQVLEINENNSR